MTSKFILVSALLLLLASCALRIRIYMAVEFDRVATPLLKDTFATSIGDLLWLRLYRARDKIHPLHRRKVGAYFWTTIIGLLLLPAAVALLGFAA